jgi:orotidine-5'-phosphate decarboxylase
MDKLQERIRKLKNPSVVDFSVDEKLIPPYILEEEGDRFLAYERFSRELMLGLKGIIPAVRFHMGSFCLMGPRGMELLVKLTAFAREQDYYILLDVPETFSRNGAELSAAALMDPQCDYRFDGLVVTAYAGSDVMKPYVAQLKASGKDLFVVLRTSNKSAAELQDLLTGSRLVHMAAADIVKRLGEPLVGRSGYSQVAAVGPASVADVLKKMREKYKSIFLLLDGYDYTNANAKNCSYAFDKLGHGAAACSGAGILGAWQADDYGDEHEYVAYAVEAAERMKKNLLRYITVL